MSTYYEEKVVDKPAGDPLPFKLNYSPRAYELPGQPISVDKSGTVTARQVGGGVPRKPFRVTAITEAAKPATVIAGALPEKPVSISILTGADAPESVTVVAAPRKPNTVSVQADPIKPASVTADAMPFAPTSVVAESDPKKPISVDADYIPHAPAIVEVNAMPIAPAGVAAFSDPKKPISVDADYIPHAPSSVDADYIPYAPSVVSVNADPKQPLTVDADYIPYAPAPVSAGQVPAVPSLVGAGVVPEAPSTVSVEAAPKQPSEAFAFEPFIVEIMETEAQIQDRSEEPGTVAFGTDTKRLYVYNETGIDAWDAFDSDTSFKYDRYSIQSTYVPVGEEGGDYFGANVQNLDLSNGFTLSSWFKFNWNANSHILGMGGVIGNILSSNKGQNIGLITKSSSTQDTLYFRVCYRASTNADTRLNFNIGTYNSDQWYHFTLTYDANKLLKIYIDGIKVFEFDTQVGLLLFYHNVPIGVFAGGVNAENWFRNSDSTISEMALWDSALTSTDIDNLYQKGVPQLLDLNPTAWWRMGDGSENANGTAIQDVTGNEYDGTINVDGGTIIYSEGETPEHNIPFNRYVMEFDGSDDELILPAIPELNSTSKFTVSLWIRMIALEANGIHFMSGSSYSDSIRLRTWNYNNQSGLDFSVGSGTVRYLHPGLQPDFILYDNNWHHIVAVFDGSNSFMLVDGSSENITTQSAMPSTAPVDTGVGGRIGSNLSVNNFSDGYIDEVAIWDSALSLADATSISEGGEPSDISNLNPLSWWRMGDDNGGAGAIVTDRISGYDATVVGATFKSYIQP